MKYGKAENGIVKLCITTDNSPRGYSGTLFYKNNGALKSAVEIVTEQRLKPIIIADETHPMTWYTFEEKASEIIVAATLTTEAEARIADINKRKRIAEIQERLDALSQDIVQLAAGEIIPDAAARKAEFVALHNELRVLLGLEPRATI